MGQVLVRLAAIAALAACGDNTRGNPMRDDAGVTDAAADVDASVQELRPCLDRPPGDLARPPTGQLPCDLVPPGFTP